MLKGFQTKLRPLLRPKRFEAFCVGLPFSGTQPVAAMFDHYRSEHEPGGAAFLRQIVGFLDRGISAAAMADILRRRNRELWLEMEASSRNVYIIDHLVELFPEAKFVLNVRDCGGWLESFLDHELATPAPPGDPLTAFRRHRFGGEFQHAPEERILLDRGLATLDGYFSYWAFHLRRIHEAVPAERLMVIVMGKLTERAADLAEFVGVPATKLNLDVAHRPKAVEKSGILAQIDPAFIRAKAEAHCGEWMHRYFPGHEMVASS
jgi:hypothetical protein